MEHVGAGRRGTPKISKGLTSAERLASILQGDPADTPAAMEVKELQVIDGVLYLYGSEGPDTSARSRLYKLDLTSRRWQRMQ